MKGLANFADRLMAQIREKNSRVCVGLDPRLSELPIAVVEQGALQELTKAAEGFCLEVLQATAEYAVAAKLQSAFFERAGAEGIAVLFRLAQTAQKLGLLTIADVKRGDIGPTAEAYAEAYLGPRESPGPFDALTVNPYFGTDSMAPFIERAGEVGGGVFVVVRTSNPSAGELQDLSLEDGRRVHEAVADLVVNWGATLVGESGYSSVGAVVAATAREHLASLRARLGRQPLLVPGYGAQGAGPDDVVDAFDHRGLGAIVNSSRGILYAYKSAPYAERYGSEKFAEAAAEAAREMRDAINQALRTKGKVQ
jgi:orotidine-5'-phosphate decarboxylase